METAPFHATKVHAIACLSFATLNLCFAILYNAIGLAIACAVVLAILWAEKTIQLSDSIRAARLESHTSTLFRIAAYTGVGTLVINVLLATRTAFNTDLLSGGSGVSGLILTAISLAAYIPLFVRLRTLASQ